MKEQLEHVWFPLFLYENGPHAESTLAMQQACTPSQHPPSGRTCPPGVPSSEGSHGLVLHPLGEPRAAAFRRRLVLLKLNALLILLFMGLIIENVLHVLLLWVSIIF